MDKQDARKDFVDVFWRRDVQVYDDENNKLWEWSEFVPKLQALEEIDKVTRTVEFTGQGYERGEDTVAPELNSLVRCD